MDQVKPEGTNRLQLESQRMEDRLRMLKQLMSVERAQREAATSKGESRWQSGKRGPLTVKKTNTTPSNKTELDKHKKPLKVKVLTGKETIDVQTANVPQCGQCDQYRASMMCVECIENYCNICFVKFHHKGSLSKHHVRPLGKGMVKECQPNKEESSSIDVFRGSPPHFFQGNAEGGKEERKGEESLLSGDYDEAASAAMFQEALKAWRNPTTLSTNKQQDTNVTSSISCGIQASSPTVNDHSSASTSSIEFTNSLSYFEKLLLKKVKTNPTSFFTSSNRKEEEQRAATNVVEREEEEDESLSSLQCSPISPYNIFYSSDGIGFIDTETKVSDYNVIVPPSVSSVKVEELPSSLPLSQKEATSTKQKEEASTKQKEDTSTKQNEEASTQQKKIDHRIQLKEPDNEQKVTISSDKRGTKLRTTSSKRSKKSIKPKKETFSSKEPSPDLHTSTAPPLNSSPTLNGFTSNTTNTTSNTTNTTSNPTINTSNPTINNSVEEDLDYNTNQHPLNLSGCHVNTTYNLQDNSTNCTSEYFTTEEGSSLLQAPTEEGQSPGTSPTKEGQSLVKSPTKEGPPQPKPKGPFSLSTSSLNSSIKQHWKDSSQLSTPPDLSCLFISSVSNDHTKSTSNLSSSTQSPLKDETKDETSSYHHIKGCIWLPTNSRPSMNDDDDSLLSQLDLPPPTSIGTLVSPRDNNNNEYSDSDDDESSVMMWIGKEEREEEETEREEEEEDEELVRELTSTHLIIDREGEEGGEEGEGGEEEEGSRVWSRMTIEDLIHDFDIFQDQIRQEDDTM